MKQTALILLAIVLVAAIALGLLLSIQPKPNMTIRAIGPTGEFVTRTNRLGYEVRCPVWRFAITNTGRANAHWIASLDLKGPEDTQREAREVLDFGLFGVLAPGSGVVTNMPVPPQDALMWSGIIGYFSMPSRLETNLWPVGARMPLLGNLFPSAQLHSSSDVWRTTTNVAPASAPPQNGTNP